MREFIAARRDPAQAPWYELKDYEEYAHLYRLAWSDPANRWLLSTLPSAMIFDDHDIRDDWNTSWTWRQEMEATDWWHDRVVGRPRRRTGSTSTWATSAPTTGADDPLWQRIASYDGPGELDLTEALDAAGRPRRPAPGDLPLELLARLRHPGPAGRRRLPRGPGARSPDRRSMLDDERAGLARRADAGRRRPPAGRHVAAVPAGARRCTTSSRSARRSPRAASGRLGKPVGREGPADRGPRALGGVPGGLRRRGRDGCRGRLRGQRGRAPRTVTFLSGDVHHSYVAEAWPTRRRRG